MGLSFPEVVKKISIQWINVNEDQKTPLRLGREIENKTVNFSKGDYTAGTPAVNPDRGSEFEWRLGGTALLAHRRSRSLPLEPTPETAEGIPGSSLREIRAATSF
jgi:hypothetical protein